MAGASGGGTVRVAEADLKRFCVQVLVRLDVPEREAVAIVDNLVEADLRGVESHGVVRLPIYALRLEAGVVNPRPKVAVSGAFFDREVTHMYEDLENPQNIGHLFGVLPVASFEDLATYRSRMDKAIREMRAAKRADGVERIYLPGEREHLLAAERRRSGIPLNAAVAAELRELGERLGIALRVEAG